jgi:hypothetical protein
MSVRSDARPSTLLKIASTGIKYCCHVSTAEGVPERKTADALAFSDEIFAL